MSPFLAECFTVVRRGEDAAGLAQDALAHFPLRRSHGGPLADVFEPFGASSGEGIGEERVGIDWRTAHFHSLEAYTAVVPAVKPNSSTWVRAIFLVEQSFSI